MEISYSEIAIIMSVVLGGFKLLEKGLDYLYKIFTKGNKDNNQETEIACIKKDIFQLQTNHLKHQEDIVSKLDKFEKALIKIAVKLQINDIFG